MVAPYLTAGDLINRAAIQCGLSTSANPYTSTDTNFVLLRNLLQMLCEELNYAHMWHHLVREHTITTEDGVEDYDLPDDFLRIVDQSVWNRTTRFPLGGPVSSQEWQSLKASGAGAAFRAMFRLRHNVATNQVCLSVFPSTLDATVALEYQTRNCVLTFPTEFSGVLTAFEDEGEGVVQYHLTIAISDTLEDLESTEDVTVEIGGLQYAGVIGTAVSMNLFEVILDEGLSPTMEEGDLVQLTRASGKTTKSGTISGASDIVLFDPSLIAAGLKFRFKEARGFEYTQAKAEFDFIFDAARTANAAAPCLSLSRGGHFYVDECNVPVTGIGS